MSFTIAEQIEFEKQVTQNKRNRKLGEDRKSTNGRRELQQTEGLKPIRKHTDNPRYATDEDDNPVDLKRITKLSDVVKDED